MDKLAIARRILGFLSRHIVVVRRAEVEDLRASFNGLRSTWNELEAVSPNSPVAISKKAHVGNAIADLANRVQEIEDGVR